MKNDWEIFEGRQYKPTARREPRVTVGPKGTFYLNGIAFEALDQPAAVEMLYNPKQRIIGLRPIDPTKHNAFEIKHHGIGGNYKRISAASFCSNYRLKFKRTLLFEHVDVTDDGIMLLDLEKTVEVSKGAR